MQIYFLVCFGVYIPPITSLCVTWYQHRLIRFFFGTRAGVSSKYDQHITLYDTYFLLYIINVGITVFIVFIRFVLIKMGMALLMIWYHHYYTLSYHKLKDCGSKFQIEGKLDSRTKLMLFTLKCILSNGCIVFHLKVIPFAKEEAFILSKRKGPRTCSNNDEKNNR